MALDKQVISIPMAMGVDTKNAPALIENEKFQLLQNVRFVKGAKGQLNARNGYTRLPQVDTAGAPISSGAALAQLNNELDLFAGGKLYGLSTSQNAWVSHGSVTPIVPTETQIVKNTSTQSNPDSATLSGVSLYAWEDTRGGVWFSVVDQASGTVLQADAQLDAAGVGPRVIVNSTKITIVWASGTAIKRADLVPTAATVAPTPANLLTGLWASTPFEIVNLGAHFGVAYLDSSSYLNATTLSFGTLAQISSQTVRSTAVTTLAAQLAGNGSLVVSSKATGTNLFCDFLNPSTLANLGAYSTVGAGGPVMVIVPSLTTPSTVAVLMQVEPVPGSADRYLIQNTFDQTTGFGAQSVFLRGVALCSDVLTYAGASYLLISYQSTEQPTYFLINAATGAVVGRFFYANAGPYPTDRLCHPMAIATGVVGFAVANRVLLKSVGGSVVYVVGLSLLQLDFTQTAVRTTQLGADLTLAGALPQIYDGTRVVEDGFNVFPEAPTVTLLTSRLGLTGFVNGDGSTAAAFKLTFPQNPDGSGNDGAMVNDTLIIDSLWAFQIGPPGSSPPTYSGYTNTTIGITALDSAAVIAKKVATAIGTSGYSGYGSTVSGGTITFTANANGYMQAPSLETQSSTSVTVIGTGGTGANVNIAAIPGSLVLPGNWISWQAFNGGFVQQDYVWFTVAGVGSDPAPFGSAGVGFVCALSGTETSTQVAAAIQTVLGANQTALRAYVTTQVGPCATIQNSENGILVATPRTTLGLGALGSTSGVALGQYDSYEWCAFYEWTDAQGQTHRSAPGVPTQLQVPTYGLGNAQVQVQVSTLRLTAKSGVDIAINRTISLGTNFYRATSATSLLYNNAAVDSLTFQDQVSDAILESNQALYTTGFIVPTGVGSTDPLPPCQGLHAFQDRMWAFGLEDPYTLWYSRDFATGVAVEWSAEQTVRVDPAGGAVIGVGSLDSNLCIFAQNRIWLLSGDGPSPAGGGTPFVGPTLVSASEGCRDSQSICVTPIGITFKNAAGFYLLNRSLQVQYVGEPVEAYNADVVSSAVAIANTSEIRFTSASGTTLLWDYLAQAWGTFTNHQAVDALVFGGTYYQLRASGAVLEETPGYYLDDTTGFPYLAQTAWIKVDGIQHFARLYKSLWEGYFPGTNPIQLQVAYNYNPTVVDTLVLNATAGTTSRSSVTPGLGAGHTYTPTLAPNIVPGSVVVKIQGGATLATDNGAGTISGAGGGGTSGTINYSSGAISFTITSAETSNNIEVDYQTAVTEPDLIQFQARNSRQTIEAVQFTIQDLPPYWQSAKKMSLNALDLEVGVKKGGFKWLGNANTIG